MLKRNFAVVTVVGLVLAGAAVAWAGGGPERPTVLAAAQSTDSTTPPGTPADPPTDEERQARREALRTCLEQAGEDRAARQACFEQAGPGAKRFARRHGPGHGPGIPGALGRAVHGEVIVPDGEGGWQEVTFDRGQVDAATDGSRIVLDRPDGPEVSVALTAETKYHGIEGAGDIVEGRPALVVSKDGNAVHVLQKDPEQIRPGGNKGAPGDVPND
jgi:hypothetical protein